MWKLIIALSALFISAQELQAQVNAEAFRGSGSQGFSGNLGADLSLMRGNNNLTSGAVSARLDFREVDYEYFVTGNVFKGQSKGDDFADNGFIHARYTSYFIFGGTNLRLTGNIGDAGMEIFVQAQYDRFKDLNLRQLTGTGFRYQHIEDGFASALGIGAMYEIERLKDSAQNQGALIRSTNYVSLSYSTRKEKFTLVGYYQPLFSNAKDYRLTADFSAETSIGFKWLKMNPYVVFMYDSKPPIDVERADLRAGLKFKITF